jgi:hypothetical protein
LIGYGNCDHRSQLFDGMTSGLASINILDDFLNENFRIMFFIQLAKAFIYSSFLEYFNLTTPSGVSLQPKIFSPPPSIHFVNTRTKHGQRNFEFRISDQAGRDYFYVKENILL